MKNQKNNSLVETRFYYGIFIAEYLCNDFEEEIMDEPEMYNDIYVSDLLLHEKGELCKYYVINTKARSGKYRYYEIDEEEYLEWIKSLTRINI